MRVMLALGCTAALFAVAACNRDEAPASNNQAESTGNQAAPEAAANLVTPTDVAAFMHDRHERYEDLGKTMKALGRELKAGTPSLPTIQRHAADIARFAMQVPSLFPPGTGPETGRRTRAKAEIWSDPQTFRQRAQAFQREAARFNQAAQSGDLAAVRALQSSLADTCKNCHERFRTREGGH
jgi:cytochrome c556